MSVSCKLFWVFSLALIFLLIACTPTGMIAAETSAMQSVCSQLEENVYYSCAQHDNWRVLKDGFQFLGNSACDPVSGESTTYRAALTSSEATLPQRKITLVAVQDVWNGVLGADDLAFVLAEEIHNGRVSVS